MQKSTLGFHITTTRFLGKQDIILHILENLKKMPSKYFPTKSELYSSRNKKAFSFDKSGELISSIPGEFLFGGYFKLYKIKRIFEFYLNWTKCPIHLIDTHPEYIFNTISFYFEDGITLLDNKDFEIIENIWTNLCQKVDAVYGNCHLYSNSENTNSYLGWGFGKCIPRLHWKTYFGSGYTDKLNYQSDGIRSNCKINKFENNSFLLTLNDNPVDLIIRSDLERQTIKLLGSEYFWDEHDSRLNPKSYYKMPHMNLDEVVYISN